MRDIKEMTEEELKKEFIKWFGEDKWNQEEVLAKLHQVVINVCTNWLAVVPIPVLFDEYMGTDEARFDIKECCIWLNPKNQNNWVQLMESTIHELEHYYQLIYVTNNDTPKAKRWKKEIENYIGAEDPKRNVIQEIEIDARAFAQLVLATDYGIKYKNQNAWLQELIDQYIDSAQILSDD